MPMPTFSTDEVTNFLVTEALVHRGMKEQADDAKKKEQKDWKDEWKKNPPKGV